MMFSKVNFVLSIKSNKSCARINKPTSLSLTQQKRVQEKWPMRIESTRLQNLHLSLSRGLISVANLEQSSASLIMKGGKSLSFQVLCAVEAQTATKNHVENRNPVRCCLARSDEWLDLWCGSSGRALVWIFEGRERGIRKGRRPLVLVPSAFGHRFRH